GPNTFSNSSGTRKIRIQNEAPRVTRAKREGRFPWFVSRSCISLTRIAVGASQRRDERQVTEIFAVIEPVADQELRRRVEADPAGVEHQLARDALVQQRTQLERLGAALAQPRHEPVERVAAVDDVL